MLAHRTRLGPDAALVFSLTGLALALPAAVLPFVSASQFGDVRISLLFTGVASLWAGGMSPVAILVLLCGGLFPLALLATLAILRVPSLLEKQPAGFRLLFQVARALRHWTIPEVQVLAVLVALMKLGSLVNLTIGPGFWCYCAMTLSLLIAQHAFDFDSAGRLASAGDSDAATPSSALASDLCPPVSSGNGASCGWRRPSAALPLALAAAVMLVPANLLPVLSTENVGSIRTDTIFSGVVGFWGQGLWALALIVFIASILIPAFKLLGLGWLLLHSRAGAGGNSRRLTRIYSAIDFIGRWSMLDVFLAAFLSGLVRFDGISTVTPRGGIVAFAAAVVLTVLATQAFDPRILWVGVPRPGQPSAQRQEPGPLAVAPAST